MIPLHQMPDSQNIEQSPAALPSPHFAGICAFSRTLPSVFFSPEIRRHACLPEAPEVLPPDQPRRGREPPPPMFPPQMIPSHIMPRQRLRPAAFCYNHVNEIRVAAASSLRLSYRDTD